MRWPGFQKVPAQIRKLLGSPPLLAIDDEDDYYRTMAAVAAAVKPRNDIVVWFSIKDAVDARLEIALFTRVKACIINAAELERKHVVIRSLKGEAQTERGRLHLEEDDEKKRALKAAKEAGKSKEEADEILAEIAARFDRKLDEMMERHQLTIENVAAEPSVECVAGGWQIWIVPLIKIDELLTASHRRYDNARDALERHRLRHLVWTEPVRPPAASRRARRRLPLAQPSTSSRSKLRRRNGRL